LHYQNNQSKVANHIHVINLPQATSFNIVNAIYTEFPLIFLMVEQFWKLNLG
jgi:hypothetical protein